MSEPVDAYVEHVARAICLAATVEGWTDNPDERMNGDGRLVTWRDYEDEAHAAIRAVEDYQ